jgi:hypothetical protein
VKVASDNRCKYAYSSVSCLVCPDEAPYYQKGENCLAECPDGFYKDDYLKMCRSCHAKCTTCTGPSELDCEGCSQGQYLFPTKNSNCVDNCYIYYLFNYPFNKLQSQVVDEKRECVSGELLADINFPDIDINSLLNPSKMSTIRVKVSNVTVLYLDGENKYKNETEKLSKYNVTYNFTYAKSFNSTAYDNNTIMDIQVDTDQFTRGENYTITMFVDYDYLVNFTTVHTVNNSTYTSNDSKIIGLSFNKTFNLNMAYKPKGAKLSINPTIGISKDTNFAINCLTNETESSTNNTILYRISYMQLTNDEISNIEEIEYPLTSNMITNENIISIDSSIVEHSKISTDKDGFSMISFRNSVFLSNNEDSTTYRIICLLKDKNNYDSLTRINRLISIRPYSSEVYSLSIKSFINNNFNFLDNQFLLNDFNTNANMLLSYFNMNFSLCDNSSTSSCNGINPSASLSYVNCRDCDKCMCGEKGHCQFINKRITCACYESVGKNCHIDNSISVTSTNDYLLLTQAIFSLLDNQMESVESSLLILDRAFDALVSLSKAAESYINIDDGYDLCEKIDYMINAYYYKYPSLITSSVLSKMITIEDYLLNIGINNVLKEDNINNDKKGLFIIKRKNHMVKILRRILSRDDVTEITYKGITSSTVVQLLKLNSIVSKDIDTTLKINSIFNNESLPFIKIQDCIKTKGLSLSTTALISINYSTSPYIFDQSLQYNNITSLSTFELIDTTASDKINISDCNNSIKINFPIKNLNIPELSLNWKNLTNLNSTLLLTDDYYTEPFFIDPNSGEVYNMTIKERVNSTFQPVNFSCNYINEQDLKLSNDGLKFENITNDQNYFQCETSHLTDFIMNYDLNPTDTFTLSKFYYIKKPILYAWIHNYLNVALFILLAEVILIISITAWYFGRKKKIINITDLKKAIIMNNIPNQLDYKFTKLEHDNLDQHKEIAQKYTSAPQSNPGSVQREKSIYSKETSNKLILTKNKSSADMPFHQTNNLIPDEKESKKTSKLKNFDPPNGITVKSKQSNQGLDQIEELQADLQRGIKAKQVSSTNINDLRRLHGNFMMSKVSNKDLKLSSKDINNFKANEFKTSKEMPVIPIIIEEHHEEVVLGKPLPKILLKASLAQASMEYDQLSELSAINHFFRNILNKHPILSNFTTNPLSGVRLIRVVFKFTTYINFYLLFSALVLLSNEKIEITGVMDDLWYIIIGALFSALFSNIYTTIYTICLSMSDDTLRNFYADVHENNEISILNRYKIISKLNWKDVLFANINLMIFTITFYVCFGYCAVYRYQLISWLISIGVGIVIDLIIFELIIELVIMLLYKLRKTGFIILRLLKLIETLRNSKNLL